MERLSEKKQALAAQLGVDPMALQRMCGLHEAGHAVYFLMNADLPQPVRVSIGADTDLDGFVELVPRFGQLRDVTPAQVERIVAGLLAGAIAVEEIAGETARRVDLDALGAERDQQQVAEVIRRHYRPDALTMEALAVQTAQRDRLSGGSGDVGRARNAVRFVYRRTIADEEALLERAVARARAFAREHRATIDAVADHLVAHGEMDATQIQALRGAIAAVRQAEREALQEVLSVFVAATHEHATRGSIERARRMAS